jgi:quercetin dioxygenase-like cupin family protein
MANELPAAAPLSPLELAAYQDGSVVSRALLKRSGGTITFFAFDSGQGLSEHTAPFDAVAHVLEGEADITISGKTVRVAQGELVLMPANQPHALSARTRFKMLLTMIRSA